MDISNLKKDMKVKNFRELNRLIEGEDCKIRTGSSKIAFLKELATLVSYDKIGNSFIIKEIYETKGTKIDGRRKNNAKYVTYTENLILHLLQECDGSVGYLSKSGFLLKTDIINEQFILGRKNYDYLADYLQIPYESIKEFYSNYGCFFTNLIGTALKSLERDKIIKVENRTLIVHKDNTTSIASSEEYSKIIAFEHGILQELKAEKKYAPKVLHFVLSKEKGKRCLDALGYKDYFGVYKIFFNKEVLNKELSEADKYISNDLLNKAIRENINRTVGKNYKKYYDKNKPDFGTRSSLLTENQYKSYTKEILYGVTRKEQNA